VPRTVGRSPLLLVALLTVVVAESARVLFGVAFHAGEDLGNLTTGLIVVLLFATPLVVAPLLRWVPPTGAVLVVVALTVGCRLAVQIVDDVGYPLAGAATSVALIGLALAVIAARRHDPAGSTGVLVAVAVGLALDTLIRATGTTWDVVWRRDALAWALTVVLLVGVVAAAYGARRAGAVPDGEAAGDALDSFLLWPFLYLALLYTQSPAFLASSGGVGAAVALATALVSAMVAVAAVGVGARSGAPRALLVPVAIVLAVIVYVVSGASGWSVLVWALVAQAGAAFVVGAAAGAARGEQHEAPTRSALAYAAGSLWIAVAMLAFALHTLQPLPFTNRLLPAVVALSTGLAALAPRRRDERLESASLRPAWSVAAALGACAVVAPLLVLVLWPATPTVDVAGRPVRVMTFNIDQGLTLGQLHLDQLAAQIESADPDVVVIEEVGRGWSVSGMTDGAEWLSRRLRMPFVWAPAADNQFGNAVFSRLPITGDEVVALGKGNGTQARSAAFVHLDAAGQDLLVIGTHLMNGSAAPMHESRAEAYTTILEHWGGAPHTVLLGDLNTYPRLVPPGWPELNLPLDAGFTTTQDLDLCVMPTSNQNCPDWIFVGPGMSESSVRVTVDRPDHRPVVAEVGPTG
jgi:endonuclease/exonuclease/phosphatase family metal-dependent hydrolase